MLVFGVYIHTIVGVRLRTSFNYNLCRSIPHPPPTVCFEKELDDLDDDLDFDDADMADYDGPESGDNVGPSAPSPPPPDFGESGESSGGGESTGDDLLGM